MSRISASTKCVLLTFLVFAFVLKSSFAQRGYCDPPPLPDSLSVGIVFFGYSRLEKNQTFTELEKGVESIFAADLAWTVAGAAQSAFIRVEKSELNKSCSRDQFVARVKSGMKNGQTLISVWGEIIQEGDEVSVVNFVDVSRKGDGSDVIVQSSANSKSYRFSADVPFGQDAFPSEAYFSS